MNRMTKTIAVVTVVAFGLGVAGAAYARAADPAGNASGATAAASGKTPSSWSYDVKDGKRVPKANRIASADGSWREESKQGSCTTVKESNAAGEIKTTRSCN